MWSLGQRQRFIDSLLNGYDVPKIYLHDLRGQHPTKVYAVVDGKQRLNAIWAYLADGFPLAEEFRVEAGPADDFPAGTVTPAGALRFSELDLPWQRRLLQTYVSVVLIRDATEEDIDELFARLNDGSPLTRAERRNALGGAMAALIRDVAARPSLHAILPFPDERGAFRDVAAAILAVEDAHGRDAHVRADLSPASLDAFVRAHRRLGTVDGKALLARVDRRLAVTTEVFRAGDRRLSTPALAAEALRDTWAALAAIDDSAPVHDVRPD